MAWWSHWQYYDDPETGEAVLLVWVILHPRDADGKEIEYVFPHKDPHGSDGPFRAEWEALCVAALYPLQEARPIRSLSNTDTGEYMSEPTPQEILRRAAEIRQWYAEFDQAGMLMKPPNLPTAP